MDNLFEKAFDYYNRGMYQEAFNIWSDMKDDSTAMYNAGTLLFNKKIDVQNPMRMAYDYFRLASSLGHFKSYYYCGFILENYVSPLGSRYRDAFNSYYYALQNGVDEGFDGIRSLAENGFGDAADLIGDIYLYGADEFKLKIIIEVNKDEALKWYNKAYGSYLKAIRENDNNGFVGMEVLAKKGITAAQTIIGLLYYHGSKAIGLDIVPAIVQDENKALEWLTKAFDAGMKNETARYISNIYKRRGNIDKYFYFEREAALAGDKSAYGPLGDCYRLGRGTQKNYNEALKWYTRGAEAGYSDARCLLGVMQLQGWGCERDTRKGIENIKLSSDAGDHQASGLLGILLCQGKGVARDFNQAYILLQKAPDNPFAVEFLGHCYYYGKGCKRDYEKARECYVRSYKMGNKHAYSYLTSDMDLKPISKWELSEDGAEALGSLAANVFGAIMTGLFGDD